MNTIIAIIFVLVMVIISTAGREFEADAWQTYFDRGMEIQDSLWKEIQAINLLEQYKKAERLK